MEESRGASRRERERKEGGAAGIGGEHEWGSVGGWREGWR